MDIRAFLDYDTPPCSRANGHFQVIELIELKDENEIDISHLATNGRIYTSIEELRRQLDMAYGMPISQIDVIEED
ncbi:hypothetical protein [Flavobacterium sp. 123]|uniref:hypothetical protein n=1 Tax=Flavobacterium sp. 123 TaxID=2135627 RepID=UPI000EB4D9AD|nr:hypothetical protein [Flavobacterium sp. 123]RKS98645.1 hypothetical protein C8C88_0392 [Flavobacterium sp. 123]